LADDQQPGEGEALWYAYLETANPSPWFNNQTYVDTLSPEAMQRFIEVTHERYKQVLGGAFGEDVPAIFTDEPQFTHKRMLRFADQPMDLAWPWTTGLDEAFAGQFGESILAHFPEVVWDLPDRQVSQWRYRYHEWVAERFSQSFSDQLGHWCDANGIALTGHMMEESTLAKQTKALGETMRSYRTMHIPRHRHALRLGRTDHRQAGSERGKAVRPSGRDERTLRRDRLALPVRGPTSGRAIGRLRSACCSASTT
jgi:hypothetical protein